MDEIRLLLETQVMFTLYLTIALGYLVGEINIKGFSSAPLAGIQVDEALGLGQPVPAL